jgi:hypothetical protein
MSEARGKLDAVGRLKTLCRGEAGAIAPWLEETDGRWLGCCVVVIILGCGLYGGVVGSWRAPEQALYTAVKLPLLIFLTCAGNALLNGILAQLLGSGLGFRQTVLAILMSFTIAAVILTALSPVTLFVLLNAPPLASLQQGTGHQVMLLSEVLFIAYAGVVANCRLQGLLVAVCRSPGTGRRVFWSWLAGNLFLGAQLSWVLRPFVGNPHLPLEFLRDHPMRGNFYETLYRTFCELISSNLSP